MPAWAIVFLSVERLACRIARVALHRPLEKILSLEQKTGAQKIRAWFAGEFLDARASNSAK